MRARPVILLAAAFLFSIGVMLLARSWLSGQQATVVAVLPQPVEPHPIRNVLVAHKVLAMGQLLKAEDLAWQSWADNNLAEGFITDDQHKPEDFVGWVVRTPFIIGEPLVEGRVVAPGDRGFLAAVMNPGMRAVSVAVNSTSGISGFVFPGDRVDLLMTHTVTQDAAAPGGAGTERRATETVMRNIRVLAIDQKTETKAGEAVVAHNATLEVTEKQTEIIALVAEMGRLSLSLHSLGDEQIASADPERGNENYASASRKQITTYTLDSQVSKLVPPFMFPGGNGGHVTVLHGGKIEDLTVAKAK
jgi:pilus assembly protein CpaB